jgi:polyamine oxidase
VSALVRPVDRVIVVGAGIAGLATASQLSRAGIPYLVLEARDRIGGRLHTIDLAGVPVDLGGSWIHHPIGNPLTALCKEHGLERDSADPMPSLTAYDQVDRRRLDRSEVEVLFRLVSDGFADASEALRDQLGRDATALAAMETYVTEGGFVGPVARRARQALRAEIEADAGDAADNQSLHWFGWEEKFGGDLFGDVPRGGYRSVVELLATGLDVRLSTEVVSVEVGADAVQVTAADGCVERGSHAVVTVPLGVLKRGSLRFDPPLPAAVRQAVDALGFGRYEKMALRFQSAFWSQEDLSHFVVFPTDEDEPAMWVFDLNAFGAGPVLCAHLFHSLTPYLLDQSRTAAVTWFKDKLVEVIGHPAPEPIATAVTSWATDPFTCGAYTHCPPGSNPAMLDLLSEPVNGRLQLAGEHTDSERTGYADGASPAASAPRAYSGLRPTEPPLVQRCSTDREHQVLRPTDGIG